MTSIKINYVRDELIGDNRQISIEVLPTGDPRIDNALPIRTEKDENGNDVKKPYQAGFSFPKDTDIDTIKTEIRANIERHILNRIGGVPKSIANTQENVEVNV